MEQKYSRKPKEKKGDRQQLYVYAFLALFGLGFIFLLFFALLGIVAGSGGSSLFGKCVAVVPIEGAIMAEDIPASMFTEGMAGSYTIAKKIRTLNGRDDVAAVLFVINSPGGSVVATNEIYREVNALEKPKVAYFREMAASGGYYVATPAELIISEPNALTGSIGVIATFVEMQELLSNLGIHEVAITSGDMKDMGSPFRNMTPEEEQLMQEMIAEVFNEFRGVILEHRRDKLNMALFEEALDARILSGRMALQIGLVDRLGSRDDALLAAADLGGIQYETIDDIPVCVVDTSVQSAGLFDVQSVFGLPKEEAGVSLQYR